MRGITAYSNDFYFGSSPQSTDAAQSDQAAPASSIVVQPNSGVTMAGSMSGGPEVSPKARLNPISIVPGLRGTNPLWAIPIFLGILVLVKMVREAGHNSSDFHPLKVDLYWFLMTTLAAVVGIPLVKAILNKYDLGPITAYVNNA